MLWCRKWNEIRARTRARAGALGAVLTTALCCLALALVRPAASAERIPGREWSRYVRPEAAGFSSLKLERAAAFADSLGSAAWMLVQDGAVVASHGDIARRFMCHSMRKSLLSGLYGPAVAHGKIGLDRTLGQLGITEIAPLTETEKAARVRDLLRSRSGVYLPAAYEADAMSRSRPARGSHAPGTWWYYNNWDFNVLGTIYRQATGQDLFSAFAHDFATPLRMQDYRATDGYLHSQPERSQHPAYPFRMSTRDLARFGLLYLREGRWGDRTILTADWVRESTTGPPRYPGADSGYGYLWWIPGGRWTEYGTFNASGVDGHVLIVLPKLGLVFVHRTDTYAGRRVPEPQVFELLRRMLDAREGLPEADCQFTDLAAGPAAPSKTLPSAVLRRYARTYRFPSGRTITVRQDRGHLVLINPQFGTFELLPSADATAFPRVAEQFELEDAGTPVVFVPGPQELRLIDPWVSRAEADDLLRLGRPSEAAQVLGDLVEHVAIGSEVLDEWSAACLAARDTAGAEAAARRSLAVAPEGIDAESVLFRIGAAGFERRTLAGPELEAWAGDYRFGGVTVPVVYEQGKLWTVRPREQDREELVPVGGSRFFLAGAPPVKFVFQRAADGRVTATAYASDGGGGTGVRVDAGSER